MIRNDFIALRRLVIRSIKIYLADKPSVFFSVLSSLILLMIYWLFLGNIMLDGMRNDLKNLTGIDENVIRGFLDTWMIAGVLSVCCFSISFVATTVLVKDRQEKRTDDFHASPVKPWICQLSYLIYVYVVTLLISVITLVFCMLFLLAYQHFYLTFTEIIGILGVILLACLLTSSITVFIAGYIKTESAHGALTGIISALLGFIVGAYMPIDMFPVVIRNIISAFPLTYCGVLFRKLLMNGALKKIETGISVEFANELRKGYSLDFKPYGIQLNDFAMVSIVLLASFLFISLIFVVHGKRKRM